jgi:FMN-dependent oxidoreductase (nitrilotriacetate monooxygenase family)
MKRRELHFGLTIAGIGYHHAAWRHPDVPADGTMRFAHYRHCAALAERGKFDFIFLADTASVRSMDKPAFARQHEAEQVRHEPLALLAAVSAITSKVGLIPTVSSTYTDPYNIARGVGALDHLSHGRAGWNLVTGFCTDEARNYGWDALPPAAERYARAAEFVDVMTGLFDGWDDDAVVRDKASGLFFDRAKMHMLDHRGRFFQVRGPLDLPPLPQRQPPFVTAGTSDQSQELAARYADVVYAGKVTLDGCARVLRLGEGADGAVWPLAGGAADHAWHHGLCRAHAAGGAGQVRPVAGAADRRAGVGSAGELRVA